LKQKINKKNKQNLKLKLTGMCTTFFLKIKKIIVKFEKSKKISNIFKKNSNFFEMKKILKLKRNCNKLFRNVKIF
jgi:hypothetical protein